MVASCHRGYDVVYISEVEGIINRTVNIFKNFFPVFSFYQVMIADAVKHRAIHIRRVHQTDMVLQSVFIADVAGVDDKCDILVGGIIPDVIRPVFLILRIEYFGIGNMDELMAAIRFDTSFPGLQAEIVCLSCTVDPPVILIVCPVTGWGGDKDKPFPFMSGKCINSFGIRFYHV